MATARRIAAHSLTAPSCQFSGLVRFPYDNLVCGIEIGGWSWSGGYQGISLRGGTGYSFSTQELTQGTVCTTRTPLRGFETPQATAFTPAPPSIS